MLCSHFSFIFLVSPAEQELLPVQPQSRSSYSPSGTQQPGPVGPGPPHSCRTSTPWVHTSILPPGMCHVTALNTWIPTHRLHLMGRARLPCSPGTSPHHGQPWVCTAPVTSTQCHGVWWNRKGFFSKRKSKPPPKGGPSSSGRVFSTWPCGAGQSAISFPSSRCRHAAGRLPAPLCTCSASVCLSKVQSQPRLAINKYVSRLTASLIIIITPKLEGWHSHRDA